MFCSLLARQYLLESLPRLSCSSILCPFWTTGEFSFVVFGIHHLTIVSQPIRLPWRFSFGASNFSWTSKNHGSRLFFNCTSDDFLLVSQFKYQHWQWFLVCYIIFWNNSIFFYKFKFFYFLTIFVWYCNQTANNVSTNLKPYENLLLMSCLSFYEASICVIVGNDCWSFRKCQTNIAILKGPLPFLTL